MSTKNLSEGGGKKINAEFVTKGAEKITEDDIKKAADRADEIHEKAKSGGPLGRFIEDIKLLVSLARDYWSGQYREIPWWAISAVAFALLYVLNPFDLIPDYIPILGQIDDAAVVAVCLMLIEGELHKYKEWKTDQAAPA